MFFSFSAGNKTADKEGEERENHDDIRQGGFCDTCESQDQREEQAEYGSHDENGHNSIKNG